MPSPESLPPAPTGVFIQTIATIKKGKKLEEIEDAIRDATRAAGLAGKKATVAIKITVKPAGKGVGETPLFSTDVDVTAKLPKQPDDPTLFFADENGNLCRRNPNQSELGMAVMEGGKLPAIGAGQAVAAASS